jgi:hypothetical protein
MGNQTLIAQKKPAERRCRQTVVRGWLMAEHNMRIEWNGLCSRADGIRASIGSSGNLPLPDARRVISSPRSSFLSQSVIVE